MKRTKPTKTAKPTSRITDAELRAIILAWAKGRPGTDDAVEIQIDAYDHAGSGTTILEVARKDWRLVEPTEEPAAK